MDRRERAGDGLTAMLAMLQGWQSQLWTALPCVIQSFDATKRTVVAASALNFKAQQPDGSFQTIDMPLLVDVPVFFPSGGGCTLTFPIREGDECLVIFASRCIDAWWQNSAEDSEGNLSTQAQVEQRMHSLSDGIAFVGLSSVPQVIPAINTVSTQLRNDSGLTYIELIPGDDPDIDPQGGTVNIVTELTCNVTAGGNVTVTTQANVIVQAQGDCSVTTEGDVAVSANGDCSISSQGACSVSGQGEVTIESAASITLTAPSIEFN